MAEEKSKKKNSVLWTGLLTLGVFFVIACVMLSSTNLTVDYLEEGIMVRCGRYGTDLTFDQVKQAVLREEPFVLGEMVDGLDKDPYYAGDFRGGDGETPGLYRVYLDKVYDGKVLIIETDEQPVVIGSRDVDMEFLYAYLRDGAGLE